MSAVSRLLYVDSNTDTAAAAAETLSAEYGFEVYTAEDVATATTALRINSIDCLISEFDLGEADGFDLLSHIRSEHESLPVVLLMDDEHESVDSGAFESGATTLFARSRIEHSIEPLVERIHELLAETSDATESTVVPDPLADDAVAPEAVAAGPSTPAGVGTVDAAGIVHDALGDELSAGEITRRELQTLDKDQLITVLLRILGDNSAAHSVVETSESTATDTPAATDESTATDPAAAASPGDAASTDPSATTEGDGSDQLSALDRSPGTTILVQSSSQDSRRYDVHHELLGLDDVSGRNVLLVRYRPMPKARLESIAAAAERVTVLTISCSQPVPDGVSTTIETIRITSASDVRRLGILATRIVTNWGGLDSGVSVSIDPLDTLFNYKTVEAVFRFLHVLLGKLSAQGAVTQVHVNPSAVGSQNSNTIKSLFDHTVTVDANGVTVDGGS